MQSKGVIKLLAILLAIACIYQLSFSLKARSVEKKAAEYAAKVSESDSLRQAAEIYYLDSVQNRPVYDLGFISFTYKEVKEKEINLGLDLKGGMNVMLEVQVEDVLKALHTIRCSRRPSPVPTRRLKRVPTTTSASSPRLIVRFPAVLRWLRFS